MRQCRHPAEMRVYLTSYQMGDEADRLLSLAGENARVAVISNALDYISPQARQTYTDNGGFSAKAWFRDHGLDVAELDLRQYFGARDQLESALDGIDLVWAVGGNAFMLLRAMRQSGFEPVLKRRLAANDLMYGGWSAGACVAGSSLEGIHLMDKPDSLSDGYEPTLDWAGLGLIDKVIVPHFQSNHGEAAAALTAVDHLKSKNMPFQTLRDGESIIVVR